MVYAAYLTICMEKGQIERVIRSPSSANVTGQMVVSVSNSNSYFSVKNTQTVELNC